MTTVIEQARAPRRQARARRPPPPKTAVVVQQARNPPAKRKRSARPRRRVVTVAPAASGYDPRLQLSSQRGFDAEAKINNYLQTLVYPERYGGVRYPDAYPRETAMVKLILQKDLFFFPPSSTVEAPGLYYCAYRPTLTHPFWQYRPFPVVNSLRGLSAWMLKKQTGRFGLRALAASSLAASQQSDEMFLMTGVPYNLKMPQVYSGTDFVNDPYQATDTSGNTFYGYTFSGGSGTVAFKVSISLGNAVVVGDTILVQVVGPSGVMATLLNYTAAGTDTVISGVSADVSASVLLKDDTVNGLGRCTGQPGVGFRITYTGVGGTVQSGVTLNSITIQLVASVAPANNIGMYPTDFPDQGQLLDKLTLYRPVSASAWVSYEGSTLQNGGKLACIMYRGGSHPNDSEIYTYSKIASTPNSYEDKMRLGSYQYWLPSSTSDTEMREPVNSEEWTHAYMAIAGIVGDPTQVNPLRIRAVANLEFVSQSQLWMYRSTIANPEAIRHAQAVLHDAPTSMSNDSHLSAIYNWLKDRVSGVAAWGVRNSGWLKPAASLLGHAATMLL